MLPFYIDHSQAIPHIPIALNINMTMELSPQAPDTTLTEGDGGGYYAWTGDKSPVLVQALLGAGKLVLHPRGFALPHYADSSKIGFVIQGSCTVGLISPNVSEEKVIIINKGDAIPVPTGSISWWFNGGDSDTTIVFLGETNTSYTPGTFNYFLLAGPLGFLASFSSEFISKIYNTNQNDSQTLAKSQTNALIFKIDDGINMPNKSDHHKNKYAFVLDTQVTGESFPLLDKIGLSAEFVTIQPNSFVGPCYMTDGSYKMVYVVKGSGHVQIIGLNGEKVLDVKVELGQMFVVPKFFIAAFVTDDEEMELFSVTTSSRPVAQQFIGKSSAWKAIPSPVLEATLNVDSQLVKTFTSNN